jgi:hypothetical protein
MCTIIFIANFGTFVSISVWVENRSLTTVCELRKGRCYFQLLVLPTNNAPLEHHELEEETAEADFCVQQVTRPVAVAEEENAVKAVDGGGVLPDAVGDGENVPPTDPTAGVVSGEMSAGTPTRDSPIATNEAPLEGEKAVKTGGDPVAEQPVAAAEPAAAAAAATTGNTSGTEASKQPPETKVAEAVDEGAPKTSERIALEEKQAAAAAAAGASKALAEEGPVVVGGEVVGAKKRKKRSATTRRTTNNTKTHGPIFPWKPHPTEIIELEETSEEEEEEEEAEEEEEEEEEEEDEEEEEEEEEVVEVARPSKRRKRSKE